MTRPIEILPILIPVAYLLGSIPVGLIVGKAKGIDPRQAGSGNIGATNLGRLLGGKYFTLVFTMDLLKGALPTLMAGALIGFRANDWQTCLLWIAVGFAAIAGHLFSIFLKFKGGKGVATSTGVILGIFPYFTLPAAVAVLTWLIVVHLTRYISVGSIIGSSAFCLAYVLLGMIYPWPITGAQWPLLCFSVLVPLLILCKHRANIARLRAGTESRVARKPL